MPRLHPVVTICELDKNQRVLEPFAGTAGPQTVDQPICQRDGELVARRADVTEEEARLGVATIFNVNP